MVLIVQKQLVTSIRFRLHINHVYLAPRIHATCKNWTYNYSPFWCLFLQLTRLYARNEFTSAEKNFIDVHDLPSNSLSLRSASMTTSGSKQGFARCNCTSYFIDKSANVVRKISSVILSVILTAPAKINVL